MYFKIGWGVGFL
ncbi:hypothetical protein LINPERPRIM_LOCUS22601 [Linum perenne]